MSSLNPAEV